MTTAPDLSLSNYEAHFPLGSIDFEPILEKKRANGKSLVVQSSYLLMVVAKKGVNYGFLTLAASVSTVRNIYARFI